MLTNTLNQSIERRSPAEPVASRVTVVERREHKRLGEQRLQQLSTANHVMRRQCAQDVSFSRAGSHSLSPEGHSSTLCPVPIR